MILPELLYEWAEGRNETNQQQAVMIVFPTQFGCAGTRMSFKQVRK